MCELLVGLGDVRVLAVTDDAALVVTVETANDQDWCLANRLVGILHGCHRHRILYNDDSAWAHRQPATDAAARLEHQLPVGYLGRPHAVPSRAKDGRRP